MLEEILKALPVALSSTVKFIFGPLGGYALQLPLITTICATIVGAMTSVVAFTFFGDWMRAKIVDRFFKNRKVDPQKEEERKMLWKKYGLPGTAFLMPLILTPIGGTVLAVSFGSSKKRILMYMFISATFWAIVLSSIVYFFGNEIFPDFIQKK
ncbi:MAG: hypothetical protein HC811_05825 [Flammeovirgaceae bacterium]|nr:hypothetical protein [Flammeovirgaceae bacterium]